MINVIVIKVYSESVERELGASMVQVTDIDEEALEELIASFTIHKNEFVLLFFVDGILCIAGLVIISQIFTKRLTEHIMEPLDALAGGANRIRNNDLTKKIDYTGDIECENVCETFNNMQNHILVEQEKFDLILLDLMLPGKSGYEICREIRDSLDIPILMVAARTESVDKIRGLGIGADDYISKPFDPAELVARVNANLRQYERVLKNNSEEKNDVLEEIRIQDLRILVDSWKVYKGDREIKFPNREFELLKFLAMNPNIVFSKEQLFEKIWGYDYVGDSATVMVHINRIREKIEDDSKNPKILETVWGAGYRLNK